MEECYEHDSYSGNCGYKLVCGSQGANQGAPNLSRSQPLKSQPFLLIHT